MQAPRSLNAGYSRVYSYAAMITAVFLALLVFGAYEWHQDKAIAPERSGGLSMGHMLVNAEPGRTVPANDPRIRQADALLHQASTRFHKPVKDVLDMTLATAGVIRETQPESALDVLRAPLQATDGIASGHLPPLPPLLAAYAQARMRGSSVDDAVGVTRSLALMSGRLDATPQENKDQHKAGSR